MPKMKVIYCVVISINWELNIPHFRLDTGENLPLVIMPDREIILSPEEIELITEHCFPDDVICKTLMPREFIHHNHTHLIVEVFHHVTKEDYFCDYPILIDKTKTTGDQL